MRALDYQILEMLITKIHELIRLKVMKKIFIIFLVLFALAALIYFYFFKIEVNSKTNAINAVPPNAVFIVDIEDPFEQWHTITEGKIWRYLKTNAALAKIGDKIDSLNNSLHNNELLWDLIASRPITVSAHKVRGNELDILYIVDLTKAARFSFIKDYIENLVGNNMKVTKRDYHNVEIIELDFKGTPDLLYLYVNNNLIIISSTHVLIENSIDQLKEPVIARDLDFIEVSKLVDDVGINIFLQHAYFKDYANQWIKAEHSKTLTFIESLVFTAINAKIDDQFLSLSGYSNLSDSLHSYAHIIHNSGKGKVEMQRIVPENSIFFLSMGFDSFAKFYGELENNITELGDGDSYFKNKKKLEKYLNISVKEDLLSWIGDEAGLLQISTSKKMNNNGFAFVLKANDIELAKEKLNHIKSQIKKKTPVKFRGIEYKGHQINFLSVKGLFKVLLGKIFNKLDKPYYTIIDEYVVFSNHPSILAQLITNNIEQKTLHNNKQFNSYFKQFDRQSSLFLYVNAAYMVKGSKEYLSDEYWKLLNKNKAYIKSFPLAGLQIKPKGRLLQTSIILNYMPQKEVMDWSSLFVPPNILALDTVLQAPPKKEESITIDDIFPDDLNDKLLTDTYANGQLKFEASLKNGIKEGSYKAYDSLGNVIVKGRYKSNKKSGTWKYYDGNGELLRKEKH